MSRQPDYLYINCDVSAASSGPPQPLRFQENRTSSLVAKADDWRVSVQRFSMFGHELPLFIPDIRIGQADINRTVYEVRVTDSDGILHAQTVMWKPAFPDPAPPSPITEQIVNNRYYWSPSYNWFIVADNSFSS
jgi:hypothetical protein